MISETNYPTNIDVSSDFTYTCNMSDKRIECPCDEKPAHVEIFTAKDSCHSAECI